MSNRLKSILAEGILGGLAGVAVLVVAMIVASKWGPQYKLVIPVTVTGLVIAGWGVYYLIKRPAGEAKGKR